VSTATTSRAATAAFLVLLLASLAGVLAVQRLKQAPEVVTGYGLEAQVLSPDGDGVADTVTFRLRPRRDDEVTVAIVTPGGAVVRRLAENRALTPARRWPFTWDGRDDAGAVVPDGTYFPRVSLRHAGRTVRLPTPLVVQSREPGRG
jgi:hypothetical protein